MLLLPLYLQVWVEKWKGAKTDCQETASAVNYPLAVILSKLPLAALIVILINTHLHTVFYFTNILHALSPLVLMKTQYRSGIVSSQIRKKLFYLKDRKTKGFKYVSKVIYYINNVKGNSIKSFCYKLIQFSSVAQPSPTLCDPMNHSSTPSLPVHHQLPEFTQTHVHWVGVCSTIT